MHMHIRTCIYIPICIYVCVCACVGKPRIQYASWNLRSSHSFFFQLFSMAIFQMLLCQVIVAAPN